MKGNVLYAIYRLILVINDQHDLERFISVKLRYSTQELAQTKTRKANLGEVEL